MKCVILAGGFGTRLKKLMPDTPKALLEIQCKPLLTHIVEKVPVDIEIIVSTNRKFESRFIDWQTNLPSRRQVDLFVESAVTEAEKPGAVTGLNMVIKERKISDDLLVIAGDNYFEFDICHFIHAFDRQNTLIAAHDIGDLEKVKGFGEITLGLGDRVTGCIEKPEHPASTLVSTACYLFPPRVFPILNDYCSGSHRDNLGAFITHLVKIDNVSAYVFTEKWHDVGSVEAYMEMR
jgi:glucose-1-phosphate thymidylyltransferase